MKGFKSLYVLLLAIPLALLADLTHAPALLTFVLAALAIIPLAALLGEGTEALASHLGPRLGGLLNATLGNAAELIITILAIRSGLLEVVKASITGSIVGNLLLVMGMSFVFGGLRHGRQHFERTEAGHKAAMLFLALIALGIPSLFGHTLELTHHEGVESLSLSTASVMLVVYALYLVYSLRNAPALPSSPAHQAHPSLRRGLALLAGSTVGMVVMSEVLVQAIEPALEAIGWTEFFVGVILVPLVGNIAEHLVAVEVAVENQMDLSLEIALGSSLQIALFVAPLLVFISLLVGHPMTLLFNPFELAALGSAALIAAMVAQDGESTWLEGVQLIAVYLILGIAFFFLH